MLNTDHAISRVRRDLALGFALKAVLLAAGLAAVVVVPRVAPHVNSGLALFGVAVVWLVLSYNSAKGSRAAADVPSLIAAGLHEEAEEEIDAALRRFSLIRVVKLQTLYQLAVLRHAQKRHRESAAVCRELLRPRAGSAGAAVARPVRLLMADVSLELDDLPAVHGALAGLYGERLSLNEVLQLLAAQLDYEARIGAWGRMTHEVMTKVQLTELMPAASAARAQALLALAAGESGRADFRDWLRDRAALLATPADLVARRPILAGLWPGTEEDPEHAGV